MTVALGPKGRSKDSNVLLSTSEIHPIKDSLVLDAVVGYSNGKQHVTKARSMKQAQRIAHSWMRRNAVNPHKLSSGVRRKGNALLRRAGLDGNIYFRKAERGLMAAFDALEGVGIEIAEVADSHLFSAPKGTLHIELAFTNYDDHFSPVYIDNSVLVLSFQEMNSGRYEVIAYLS